MFSNVFILGAAKCGTTSLSYYLNQHPEIYVADGKETHFFDRVERYEMGPGYYSSFYSKSADGQVLVDATPAYFHRPEVVLPRLKEFYRNEKLKFIIVLRDRTERALSHYLHRVRNGKETRTFDTAVEFEIEKLNKNFIQPSDWDGYIYDGCYGYFLKEWTKFYKHNQFFLIGNKDLKEDPLRTVNNISKFLGLSSIGSLDDGKKNIASEPRFKFINQLLNKRLPVPGKIRRTRSWQRIVNLKVGVRRLNQMPSETNAAYHILEGTQTKINKYYEHDDEILECIIQNGFEINKDTIF